MKNLKVVFLILHYFSIDDTIKSIESIDKLKYKNKCIIVVDNASSNGTGLKLKKMYESRKDIHIILSEKNLGFANGNNLGFKYAKKNLNPDFIVMINNDVYMIQENFCDLIVNEYEYSKFDVLGPRILMNNNIICAYIDKLPSLKVLKQKRVEKKLLYYFNKIYLRKLLFLILKLNAMFKKNYFIDTSIRKENVMLQGSCLIFSKKYIEKFDGLDDRTFLYYEEPLLYIRIKKNGMKSIYNPYLMVYHNENSSTNKTNKNKRKKFDFVLRNELKSLNILIDEVKNIE